MTEKSKEKTVKIIKGVCRVTLDEFTRLGMVFLPTAGGADLPLPPKAREKNKN